MAEWNNDKLTVWTGTQRPFGVRGELAEAFHIPEEKVRVIVPDTGSGYGGKHTGECAIEAARLARASGKPVKLVWTREEEFTWAYFRPAGVIDIKSGVKNDGMLTAWEFHNYNSGPSGFKSNMTSQTRRSSSLASRHPAGFISWPAATANHFARKHILTGGSKSEYDPLRLRQKNVGRTAKAVLEATANSFGWGKVSGGRWSGSRAI